MKSFFTFSLILFLLFQSKETRASHIMGGEITWECLPSGLFRFEMKIYRDCSGISLNGSHETLAGHNGAPNIHVTLISVTDISPNCAAGAGIPVSCGTGPPFTGMGGIGEGAVQENIYRSGPIMIWGTPPLGGWIFTWDSCCRSPSIVNIIGASGTGHTLRAIMHRYAAPGAGIISNTSPCYDSSPKFLESPLSITSAGLPLVESNGAVDTDSDSLYYFFALSLDDMGFGTFNPPTNPSVVNYASGFSENSPFPDTSTNPLNSPVQLNSETGIMEYTSFDMGAYIYDIGVKSYRDGQLLSVIYRSFAKSIGPNQTNAAPSTSFSIGASSLPISQVGGAYYAMALPGDAIDFNLSSSDTDSLGNNAGLQSIELKASGFNFANPIDSTNSNNCPFPPCASLKPIQGQVGFINLGSNSADFNWTTDYTHLTGNNTNGLYSTNYSFIFEFLDDYCPVPARTALSLLVKVQLRPAGPPQFDSIILNPNNSVSLHYVPPTDTNDIFGYYLLYHKSAFGNPQTYSVLDTIYSHLSTQSVLAMIPAGRDGYYYIQSNNKHNLPGLTSDTLAFGVSVGLSEFSMNALFVSMQSSAWIVGGIPEGLNDIEIVALDGRIVHSVKGFEGEEYIWRPNASLSKGMYLILVKGERSMGHLKNIVP